MQKRKTLLGTWKERLRTISPNCQEASRLQSELLDHTMSPWQRFGLRLHLILCKWCRRYGKQIRFLRTAAYEHPDHLVEASSKSLSTEARERIKRSLRDKSA